MKAKILIVDNEEEICYIIKRFLLQEGYEMLTAIDCKLFSNITKHDVTEGGFDKICYIFLLFQQCRNCVVLLAVIFLQLQCPFRH
jgi:CheY-like chemotaxis protein